MSSTEIGQFERPLMRWKSACGCDIGPRHVKWKGLYALQPDSKEWKSAPKKCENERDNDKCLQPPENLGSD